MIIFAHRGMKNELPENTIPAFEAAFLRGFGIEFDVRMTPDGLAVITHDKVLSKTTSMPLYKEVCELIANKVPTEQKAAIHLKYEEQTEEMLFVISESFKKYDLYQKAFVFDVTLDNADRIKQIDNKIPLALSVGEKNYSPTIYRWEEILSRTDNSDYIWLDEWNVSGSVLNEQSINEIHKTNKEIYVISPELHREHKHPQSEHGYEEVWRDLERWGIDGICTAYPDKLRAVLSS